MQDLFTQALGINSPWFIKDVSFDNKQLSNTLTLKKALNLQIVVLIQKHIQPMTPKPKPIVI